MLEPLLEPLRRSNPPPLPAMETPRPFAVLEPPSNNPTDDKYYYLTHHLQASTMVPVPWHILHEEVFQGSFLASVSPQLKWPRYGTLQKEPHISAPSLRRGAHSSLLLLQNGEVLVGPVLLLLPLLSHVVPFPLYL